MFGRKGGFVIHVGAPLLIVLFVLFYIYLTIYYPSGANQVSTGIHTLAQSIKP